MCQYRLLSVPFANTWKAIEANRISPINTVVILIDNRPWFKMWNADFHLYFASWFSTFSVKGELRIKRSCQKNVPVYTKMDNVFVYISQNDIVECNSEFGNFELIPNHAWWEHLCGTYKRCDDFVTVCATAKLPPNCHQIDDLATFLEIQFHDSPTMKQSVFLQNTVVPWLVRKGIRRICDWSQLLRPAHFISIMIKIAIFNDIGSTTIRTAVTIDCLWKIVPLKMILSRLLSRKEIELRMNTETRSI